MIPYLWIHITQGIKQRRFGARVYVLTFITLILRYPIPTLLSLVRAPRGQTLISLLRVRHLVPNGFSGPTDAEQ